MAQVNDRAHNRRIVRIFADVGDKRLIDLQCIDWKTLQVVKRRITGAEIVNCNLDSHQFQLVQFLNRLFRIFHDRAFGQLKLEPARIEIRLFQYLTDVRDKRRLLELTR